MKKKGNNSIIHHQEKNCIFILSYLIIPIILSLVQSLIIIVVTPNTGFPLFQFLGGCNNNDDDDDDDCLSPPVPSLKEDHKNVKTNIENKTRRSDSKNHSFNISDDKESLLSSLTTSPCDSFYDHVCKEKVRKWDSNTYDNTFKPIMDQNEKIMIDLVSKNDFFRKCLKYINDDDDDKKQSNVRTPINNNNFISSIHSNKQDYIYNNSGIDRKIIDIWKNGKPFLFEFSVEKMFHRDKYYIDIDINPSVVFHINSALEDQYGVGYRKKSKHKITLFLFNIIFNILFNSKTISTQDMSQETDRNIFEGKFIHKQTSFQTNDNKKKNRKKINFRTLNDHLYGSSGGGDDNNNNDNNIIDDYIKEYKKLKESHLHHRWIYIIKTMLGITNEKEEDDIYVHVNGKTNIINRLILDVFNFEKHKSDLFLYQLNTFFNYLNNELPYKIKFISNNHNYWYSSYETVAERENHENNNNVNDTHYDDICHRLTRLTQKKDLNLLFWNKIIRDKNNEYVYKDMSTIIDNIKQSIIQIFNESNSISHATKRIAESKIENIIFYILKPTFFNDHQNDDHQDLYSQFRRRLQKINQHNLDKTHDDDDDDDDDSNTKKQITNFKASNYHNLNFKNYIDIYMLENSLLKLILIKKNYLEHRKKLGSYLYETVSFDIVNAWYNPTKNIIVIPPGILQYPIYHYHHHGKKLVDNLKFNIANMGAILGHEMGHSTDIHGKNFDKTGNWILNSHMDKENVGFWRKTDINILHNKLDCLINDYGHPCGNEKYGINTLGEDMADQMGVMSAYKSIIKIKNINNNNNDIKTTKTVDNEYKLFFYEYATLWCKRQFSRKNKCKQVYHDVHALARHRVDKTLRQIPYFREQFQCKYNDHMVNINKCIIY